MIVMKRTVPIRIRKNEVLLRRLSANHPKKGFIEEDNAKRKKGFRGEESLDYYLSFLPEKEYFILHGLRLPHGEFYFQIDLLIISPNMIYVIEIKSVKGTVILGGSFKQMIRMNDGNEEGFADPLTQVKRQKYQLHLWLEKYGLNNLPIEHLVLFSDSSTIIKAAHNDREVTGRVSHSNQLIMKINAFNEANKKNVSICEYSSDLRYSS